MSPENKCAPAVNRSAETGRVNDGRFLLSTLAEPAPKVKPDDLRKQALIDQLNDPNQDAREVAADGLFKDYPARRRALQE
jgi:hypothetical protein